MGIALVSGSKNEIGNLLSLSNLRELAWGRSFERGEEYAADGLVHALRTTTDAIAAKVSGTRTYRVKLRAVNGEIDHDCNCPVGMDGLFCKHCVAVGLAWLDGGGIEPEGGTSDLEIYLESLDKKALIALLLERAEEDDRLYRRLEIQCAGASNDGPDLAAFRGAFDDALETGGFVDWGGMCDFSSGADEVVDALEDLLTEGHAAAVVELAEYGLNGVERAIEFVDDSDGWMGGLLERLQELHLAACLVARPDPEELAARLFEAQMESGYGVFHGAAETYKGILGKAGLSEYRRLAEAEWAKFPALGSGDDDPHRYGSRHTITSIMESLARASGDVEALIAVKSKDLSTPWDFLDIAKTYLESDREDEALEWAERGFAAFPDDRRDERLREFLADIHHRRGSHDVAMALVWEAFEGRLSFHMYQELESHARKAKTWPKWRERALGLMRERLDAQPSSQPDKRSFWRIQPHDGTDLVQVFLYEKNVETAWREAQKYGCSNDLWLELAKRREKTHPDGSVAIYRKHIDNRLRHTGNQIYEEVVGYLARMEKLDANNAGKATFKTLIAEIRNAHKRKRNLMKLLDQRGW